MTTHEIVPSISVANLVNQRAAVMERMRQAFALIREAGDIARAAHLGMPDVKMSLGLYRQGRYCDEVRIADSTLGATHKGPHYERDKDQDEDAAKMLRHGVDAGAWQYLMSQSGLRSLMDAEARKKWDEQVSEGNIPELTEENIHGTFAMLHDSRGDMFERGVLACFKALSWHYKTNLPQKFGKRIVITYLTGSYGHDKCNQLDDLMRVLSILDGKPEPDHRQGVYSMLSNAGAMSYSGKAGECANDYLSIRFFKNHNGHITFKRPELVEKMNKIIAKHYPNALPAPK